jgi:hypothetical protein
MVDTKDQETKLTIFRAFWRYITAENVIVVSLSEGLGLSFCYAGADRFMSGDFLRALAAFAIGLPFVILGGSWPFLKERIPLTFRNSVKVVFLDFRGWLAIALIGSFYILGPQLVQNAGPKPRHISREAAERFQDIIAPYGNIHNPMQRGRVTIVRCQNLEAAELLRDIYDPFYNVHWNVHESNGRSGQVLP